MKWLREVIEALLELPLHTPHSQSHQWFFRFRIREPQRLCGQRLGLNDLGAIYRAGKPCLRAKLPFKIEKSRSGPMVTGQLVWSLWGQLPMVI